MSSLTLIWKSFRPVNLLIILLTTHGVMLAMLGYLQADTTLAWAAHLALLPHSLAVALAAGAGNLWNDIQDIQTDEVNRPGTNPMVQLSSKSARTVYGTMAIGALILGSAAEMMMAPYHITIAIGLYAYSRFFQQRFLLGNLTVSFLCALPALIAFASLKLMDGNGRIPEAEWTMVYSISWAYAGFAFLLTWLREHVKDIQDREGDGQSGYRTAAIRWTEQGNKLFLLTLLLTVYILEAMLILWLFVDTEEWMMAKRIGLVCVLGILFIIPSHLLQRALIKGLDAERMARMSRLLKWKMVLGLLSCLLFAVF